MNSQSELSLEKLIVTSKAGDIHAFHELYERLSQPVFGFVVARTNSRDDAKDILQDTFIDIWRALPKFSYSSDKELYSFVYTIAKRKLARYYKSQDKTIQYTEQHVKENYESMDAESMSFLPIIQKLKPKYREVLELRYWSQLPFADIAKFLKTQETTVKVRHHRALAKLKTLIIKYET